MNFPFWPKKKVLKTVPYLLDHKNIGIFLDRITFLNILFVWTGTITLFGITYHLLSTSKSYLFSNLGKQTVTSLLDSIYFSFITATSTGFGDIVPIGKFKVIAIFEVVTGLLLLSFVTFKLVSLKQDIILNEIYEISFSERINRIRSSLLLFRQNINRIIAKVEDATIRNREVQEIKGNVSTLEDILTEISAIYMQNGKTSFAKTVDPLNTELIFNSVQQSFERILELAKALNEGGIEWKREITLNLIHNVIKISKDLLKTLQYSKVLPITNLLIIINNTEKVHENLKAEMIIPEEDSKIEIIPIEEHEKK